LKIGAANNFGLGFGREAGELVAPQDISLGLQQPSPQ
jgi:hypothetical protein